MLGISIMMGFFRIGSEWDKEITSDVTTLINNIIAAEFPDLEDLDKLEDYDLQILMTRI